MQPETQYFKAVPVSEKPKEDGYYQCLRGRDKSWYELYFYKEQWHFYKEEAIEGYDPVDSQSYTHYLQPIPLPDAAVLREALELLITDYEEAIKVRYRRCDESKKSEYRKIIDRAREALSQTGDGWVRVEDGLPQHEEGKAIEVNVYSENVVTGAVYHNKEFYLSMTWSEEGTGGETITHNVTHWRPLPPQPINK